MPHSRSNEAKAEQTLEELTKRLLIMVRDSGEKREMDLRTAIALKIKETEVPGEDQ